MTCSRALFTKFKISFVYFGFVYIIGGTHDLNMNLRNLLLSLSTYQINKLKMKYFTLNFYDVDENSLVFLRVFIFIESIFTIHLILLSVIMSLSFMKEPTEGSRANRQVSNERPFISPKKTANT